MDKLKADSNDYTTSIKKTNVHILFWTVAWLASMVLAVYGPRLIWDFATLPTILGVLFNLAVGFGMIFSTKRHVQTLDELGKKIFLDAAAITLGVVLVCGISYELLEDIRLISGEPQISFLIVLMSLTFMASHAAGHWKYR